MMIKLEDIVIPKDLFKVNDLSWSEKIVLSLIRHYELENPGFSHTNREIAEAIGIGRDQVSRILNRLKKKDYIEMVTFYVPETKQFKERRIAVLKYWNEEEEGE